MSAPIVGIEINFGVPITLDKDEERELHEFTDWICRRYTQRNPGRIMWPFGYGSKILFMPIAADDDRPMQFDESVLEIECAERVDYKWICVNCFEPAGQHEEYFTGGIRCKFEPAPRKVKKHGMFKRLNLRFRRAWRGFTA